MGGGGSAGKVGFPRYLERQHGQFLTGAASSGDDDITPTTTIYDLWETGLGVGGNPFSGHSYSDPAADFDAVEALSSAFETEVGSLAASDEVSNAVKAATDAADSVGIDLATRAFQDTQKQNKARSIRAFSGQMAGINAVNSTAYMFGIALIESAALQNVENFRADLTLNQQQQLTQAYIQIRSEKLALMQATATLLLEIKRIRFVAEGEFVGNEVDLSHRHASWDWEVVLNTVNAMGGLGGGTALPRGPSKAGSVIGGALSGAATGAAIGSVVPGLSTAVGAGIGGVIGGTAGLIS